jgi:imidazolonepropionase-like amidohydrolase
MAAANQMEDDVKGRNARQSFWKITLAAGAALLASGAALPSAEIAVNSAASSASTAPASVYENALVWNGKGFKNRRVAIKDGLFIDPAAAGAHARRVNLQGGFMVPGFGNAHFHLTSANEASSSSALAAGVFYIWNPNTIVTTQPALGFFARKDTFDVLVSQGGVTEPGGHPERGYVEFLSKHVYKGMTLKDFLGNAFHYGRTPAEIDATLDLLKEQKAGFVKAMLLHSEEYGKRRDDPDFYGRKGLNPAIFPYLVQAAKKRGLFTYAHVETAADLKLAAQSGAAVAGHLPGYGYAESAEEIRSWLLSPKDARMVARSGMLLVPTYNYGKGYYASKEKEGTLDRQLQARTYAAQAHNVRLLKKAGASFLMGTDTDAAIFEEAEHLARIGAFTPAEVATIALNTGKRLFPARRLGCFDPGCEADFLVLEANPLKDIAALRRIRTLVKAGRELAFPTAAAR